MSLNPDDENPDLDLGTQFLELLEQAKEAQAIADESAPNYDPTGAWHDDHNKRQDVAATMVGAAVRELIAKLKQ